MGFGMGTVKRRTVLGVGVCGNVRGRKSRELGADFYYRLLIGIWRHARYEFGLGVGYRLGVILRFEKFN